MKRFIPLFVLLLALPRPCAGADVFTRDSGLISVLRCANLAAVDGRLAEFLRESGLSPQGAAPLAGMVGEVLNNAGLGQVRPDTWVECLLFSLPLEADNDWVYLLRTAGGEVPYIEELLKAGNIRRESTEEGITRFRVTSEESFTVFHMGFAGDDILVLGRNLSAVTRARKLYAFAGKDGMLATSPDDLTMVFHLNRFVLSDPRFIGALVESIRRDVLYDLAGSQAKSDNPLNLGLERLLGSGANLLRELAVLEVGLSLREEGLQFGALGVVRYGGVLHYALANAPERRFVARGYLPDGAGDYSCGLLWPEAYTQVLQGLGAAAEASFGATLPEDARAGGERFLRLLGEAGPANYASCLVSPPEQKGAGPFFLTVVEWQKPETLSALWQSGAELLTLGAVAELFAEKGIKFEVTHDPQGAAAGGWRASRTTLRAGSMSFAVPGVLGKNQRFLSAVEGRMQVILTPAAPLSPDEYRALEPFMRQELAAALGRIQSVTAAADGEAKPAAGQKPVFVFQMNPLRYLQTAFRAQAVWPQEADPNRLPVPWAQYSAEFARFKAGTQNVLGSVEALPEGFRATVRVPYACVRELAGACLDAGAPAAAGQE